MNAMLSVPRPALTLGELQAYEGVTSIEARMAMREVKRMLARTEPFKLAEGYEGYTGHSDMRVTVRTRDYSGYRVACDTLADALAAFCAADDPAGYLAGVQEVR